MSKANGAGISLTLTPPEEWRRLRVEGAETELASTGRVIKWRPVNLTRMLQEGKIPDHLTSAVAHRLWLGKPDDELSDQQKLIEWQDYHELVAKATLIFPRVVDDPQGADEIAPDDLLDVELIEIERMARSPVEEVRRFRTKQGGDVEARPKGREVRQAAE